MAFKAEQIGRDRRIVNVPGKELKKITARKRRRAAKKLMEDAPKRNLYEKWYA